VFGERRARDQQPLVLGHGLPADEDQASAGFGGGAQVGERGGRVGEKHHPEPGDDDVEAALLERVDLGVTFDEGGVGEPG
jgi:hypothetical protein